mmetsp:Transcript_126123/g.315197  ORF Transcript_126123/g.315197 Transcript_126123/m.315197 type:complete len:244 (+) Transcript_126123:199-930(+)
MEEITYTNHKDTKNTAVAYLTMIGPPSSPPTNFRLATRVRRAMTAQTQKTETLNFKSSPITMNLPCPWFHSSKYLLVVGLDLYVSCHSVVSPAILQYTAPINQGSPRPRKTLTELLPVTLPTDASAYGSCSAATFDANVSGREVPKATSVMAVIESGRPTTQPSIDARSPIRAVTMPIIRRAQTKHSQPPAKSAGGIRAKMSFQNTVATCMIVSIMLDSFSSSPPLTNKAQRNWSRQFAWPIL